VTFTNDGEEPIEVNRGGNLEYLVSDTKGKPLAQTIKPRNGSLADDYVELQPGDSTAVKAPAELLAGVASGWVRVRVTYSNPNAGKGSAAWYGTRETSAWIRSSGPSRPASAGFSQPGTVVNAPAPSYTELAARARVQGDVSVSVTILPTGEVAKATVLGEGLPMGLSTASVEAVKAWRFAKSEIKRSQEIVFEFRVVGACDPEPPPFEWIGGYRLRVWAPRMRLPGVRYVLTFDKNGELHCDAVTGQVPQCDP
jgi:TonB family protein